MDITGVDWPERPRRFDVVYQADVRLGRTEDGGATWVEAAVHAHQQEWVLSEIQIDDYVDLTSQVHVRFWTDDTPNNSKTEAAVDAVLIYDVSCP